MTAKIVYLLCALGSASCAFMLIRGYLEDRTRLLLWASLCFVGLTLNNTLLYIDLVLLPEINFFGSFWRNMIGAVSGTILLYGLIWELT